MRQKIAVKKGEKVLWNCLECATTAQKMRGLMFRKKAIALLFSFDSEARSANAIHSFFCPRFDAIFLDSIKKIVDIRPNIAAWNPWIVPAKPAKYLIELPAGESSKVKIGEKLEFDQ